MGNNDRATDRATNRATDRTTRGWHVVCFSWLSRGGQLDENEAEQSNILAFSDSLTE